MEHLMEMLDLVTAKFSDFADSNVVVGEPVKLDKVTIVPLIRVNVGFGGGGGQGEGDFAGPHKGKRKGSANCSAGKGIGGGAGAGGKARPVGVIVFDEDGVSVHAIPHKKGLLDKLFDRVPEVIELIKKAQDGKSSSAE